MWMIFRFEEESHAETRSRGEEKKEKNRQDLQD